MSIKWIRRELDELRQELTVPIGAGERSARQAVADRLASIAARMEPDMLYTDDGPLRVYWRERFGLELPT